MVKNIPDGVYPTMVTPFTEDNKVDYNGVLELLNWYSEKGVDGIFAICQSSEIFFLSFEERLELLKFIMKNLPKGMSVVASGPPATLTARYTRRTLSSTRALTHMFSLPTGLPLRMRTTAFSCVTSTKPCLQYRR